MRKLFLFLAVSVYGIESYAALIIWDGGGGDGQWNTAANWVGDVTPAATDDVLLDNSLVAGTYTINLPAGAMSVTVNSLTISPSGINVITLILLSTNTANPGLSITGPGDALILNSGSVLRNSSGAAIGSGVSITNTLRINNGGRYIHNTTRGNAAIVSQLSAAAGTELGEFEFDVPAASYLLSLSNRTYGTLILSSVANGGTATYTGGGASPLTINGNLVLNNGVTFSISMSADMIVKGNFNQSASSIFNLQNSTNNNLVRIAGDIAIQGILTESNTGLPQLELNGTAVQDLSVSGSVTNSIELIINNPSGIILQTAVSLPYNLTLTNGKITTTSGNLLTMADNTVVSGGSVNSFIQGPMKKTGNDDFTFPVGEGGIYAPISMSGGSAAAITDEFTAQYFRLNPQTNVGPAVQNPPLDHVSYVEYWSLQRNIASSATKQITLTVNETSFAKDDLSLRVARYDGAMWVGEGGTFSGSLSAPPYYTGTVLSNTVSNFGFFTLASTISDLLNPLPVKLTVFIAEKRNDAVLLYWKLADVPLQQLVFEIEKSEDGTHFRKIAAVNSGNIQDYRFTDINLPKGVIYYRIRIKESTGKASLSETRVILNNGEPVHVLKLYPNPCNSDINLQVVVSSSSEMRLEVFNLAGKPVARQIIQSAPGDQTLKLNCSSFPPGYYFIKIIADNKTVHVLPFMKL